MTNLFPQWTNLLLTRGLRVAGIFLLAMVLIRLLRTATNKLIRHSAGESASRAVRLHEQQTQTFAGILNSAGVGIIIAISILMILREIGYDITILAAAAGLASVAVGFGAQNLVRDIINGFFIVFEDQFVVGDTIRVGETVGRVEHITLRRTVLRDPQGALVTVLNGQIQMVANLSRDWAQVFINVTVAADAPKEAPLLALDRVSAEFRADAAWSGALVDGPRVLGVDAIGPQGAKLLVQVRTAPSRQDDVARELRRRICARFEAEGIRTTGVQHVEVHHTEEIRREANDEPGNA
jgi:moderate conductance mechanosensitive channel